MSTKSDAPQQSYLKIEESKDGVAIVTLNRPEARNAFNGAAITEMKEAFEYLTNADNVNVARVRGEGSIFCAGMDLKYSAAMKQKSPEENAAASLELAQMFKAVVECSRAKPMVVEVQGGAYGGASVFLGGNSYVIAEENARMGLTEVTLGIGPFTVGPSVIHKLGPVEMSKLALSGRIITATEGKGIGLVNDVVATAGELNGKAEDVTRALLDSPSLIRANEQGSVKIPTLNEQAMLVAESRRRYPAVAPNATRVTMAVIWNTYALMQEDGEPYSDRVVEYTAAQIAELRLLPEAQQAAAFFSLSRYEKKAVAGTADDPREWIQPAPGA